MDSAVERPSPLKEQFQRLLALQELDRQLSSWEQQRQELAAKAEKSRAQVAASQAKQAELKKSFEIQQRSRGALELDVKSKQEAIKKYTGQLGELKSNEAYTTMTGEIKRAQQEIAVIEEKILGLMENEEAARKKFDEDAKALATRTAEDEADQARTLGASRQFEEKAQAEQARRQSILDSLEKPFSEAYLKLFKPKKGVPVARVANGTCDGCSMKVPQHLINELRKTKGIVYCQHCGRILVVPENL